MADDPISRFLRWGFGAQRADALVLSFKDPPDKRPLGVGWPVYKAGWLASKGMWPPPPGYNNYFCVSLFTGDRRQAQDHVSTHVYAIDDVGQKVDAGMLLDRFGTPGWVIETSPGNYQWFYRLVPAVTDRVKAERMLQLVWNKDMTKQQDGQSVTRLMRLPVGANTKSTLGIPFPTRLVSSVNGVNCSHGDLNCDEVLASWDANGWTMQGGASAAAASTSTSSSSGKLLTRIPGKDVLDLIGDDPVGKMLLETGRVRGMIPSRLGLDIQCPWESEHTIKTTTGTAYFPKTGGFECHHAHCQGRTGQDLKVWLEEWMDRSGCYEGGLLGSRFKKVEPEAVVAGTPPVDDRPYREKCVERYVYVETENRYLDTLSLNLIAVEAFNTARREDLKPWLKYTVGDTVKYLTPHLWFTSGAGRIVHAQSYWPGRGLVFEEAGVSLVNLFKPALRPLRGTPVSEQDVGPWIELADAICAAEGPAATERMLDLFALIVGAPHIKPGYHLVLVSSEHGIGKDMLIWPLLRAVGEGNVAAPAAAAITSGFNPFAEKRLVSVTDLERNTRGAATAHDIYETIKPWTQNTSRFLEISKKYQQPYQALNISAWIITSNAGDALPLSESDRRFLVILSQMKPRGVDYYHDMMAWNAANWAKVQEYLIRRWETMPTARRDLVMGRAPMTAGKQAMIRQAEDRLTAWTREQIEDGIWPDLMTGRDVQDAYESGSRRAGLYVPIAQKWRSTLHRLGAKLALIGEKIQLGSTRQRLWIIRCPERYETMSAKELAKAYAALSSRFDEVKNSC